MKRFRTVFYMSAIDGKVVDDAIAISTGILHCWRLLNKEQRKLVLMGLSHEEIWTPDEDGNFIWKDEVMYPDGPLQVCGYAGTMYTSTMGQAARGKNNIGHGTCKRSADLVLKHPGRWCFVEWKVDDLSYYAMVAYLEQEVRRNKGYGLGPNKNICSEISHNANVMAGTLKGKFRVVTPLKDAILHVKAGGVVQMLEVKE